MTAGAVILMSIESGTARIGHDHAAMVRTNAIDCIKLPCLDNHRKWTSVVVHSSTDIDRDQELYHFVIKKKAGKWLIVATDNWEKQVESRHLGSMGRQYPDSVGVCLAGNFTTNPPKSEQFQPLMILVNELQKRFNVNADSVYLRRELDPDSRIPGKTFPANLFNSNLLR